MPGSREPSRVTPREIALWRGTAARAHWHVLARPVARLADAVELLEIELRSIVADNHRLRADLLDLQLANQARGMGSDRRDE